VIDTTNDLGKPDGLVKNLLELMRSSSPVAIRLSAARDILAIGMKARVVAALEKRRAALEEQTEETPDE